MHGHCICSKHISWFGSEWLYSKRNNICTFYLNPPFFSSGTRYVLRKMCYTSI